MYMQQFEESYTELSVLLVMSEKETTRLLGVVLDGFGYKPIECSNQEILHENLLVSKPFAALVDMQLEKSEDLCKMVSDHGSVKLIILIPENEPNPEQRMQKLHADAWAFTNANPETLLTNLRNLLNSERE